MTIADLQARCELGQRQLMGGEYLLAERILADAERAAWQARDFDTLARVYMPLQETRRQRRQRCGEGIVCLDLCSNGPDDRVDGRHVVENYPFGQLLVAGWMSLSPAIRVRQLQSKHGLYVETFLGAVYPTRQGRMIIIAPLEDSSLPAWDGGSSDDLRASLPPHCLMVGESELPAGPRKSSAESNAHVMGLWERLHRPFLLAADAVPDPLAKMQAYRRAIAVDYACELAHQKLADVAGHLKG